jgi:hypothetical protein
MHYLVDVRSAVSLEELQSLDHDQPLRLTPLEQ